MQKRRRTIVFHGGPADGDTFEPTGAYGPPNQIKVPETIHVDDAPPDLFGFASLWAMNIYEVRGAIAVFNYTHVGGVRIDRDLIVDGRISYDDYLTLRNKFGGDM